MDDSGKASYKASPKQKYFLSSTVLISEECFSEVEETLDTVKESLPVSARQRWKFDFHAYKLFYGVDEFKFWGETARNDTLFRIAEVINMFSLPIAYGCVNKERMITKYKDPFPPEVMTFIQCGDAVDSWVRMNADQNTLWIPLVGEGQQNFSDIIQAFRQCKRYGPGIGNQANQPWERVTEVVLLKTAVKSQIFWIADFVAFVAGLRLRRQKDRGLYETVKKHFFASKIWPSY